MWIDRYLIFFFFFLSRLLCFGGHEIWDEVEYVPEAQISILPLLCALASISRFTRRAYIPLGFLLINWDNWWQKPGEDLVLILCLWFFTSWDRCNYQALRYSFRLKAQQRRQKATSGKRQAANDKQQRFIGIHCVKTGDSSSLLPRENSDR